MHSGQLKIWPKSAPTENLYLVFDISKWSQNWIKN
jgi:hypothetical protein